jgi:hypothetical protein
LSWEQGTTEISRVDVSNGMIVGIPTPEAKVETADRSMMIIDDDDLV